VQELVQELVSFSKPFWYRNQTVLVPIYTNLHEPHLAPAPTPRTSNIIQHLPRNQTGTKPFWYRNQTFLVPEPNSFGTGTEIPEPTRFDTGTKVSTKPSPNRHQTGTKPARATNPPAGGITGRRGSDCHCANRGSTEPNRDLLARPSRWITEPSRWITEPTYQGIY
jgi:hypothetical protein